MTMQQQLTEFLHRHFAHYPRTYGAPFYFAAPDALAPWSRPTSEQLAEELVEDAEFQALRLGSWLNTPDGELIAAAVTSVSPAFYESDIRLIIEALQLAAQMQQERSTRTAGKVLAVAAVVGALLIAANA